MLARGILGALLGAASLVSAEKDGPQLLWWTERSLVKVKAADPAPSDPVAAVEISAARNEFESFQIVLRAEDQAVSGLDVTVSDLQNAAGEALPSRNVRVYAVRFLDLRKPSSIEGGTGLWPDPLVPRIDAYEGEKRNAFPLSLRPGSNQPIWIEIFVPPGTAPGAYSGAVTITRGSKEQFSVPFRLRVWSFALPSTSSLPTTFGFNGVTALKQHYGRYTTDSDLHSLTRVYMKAALFHRISIHGGSMAPPAHRLKPDRIQIDWRRYDSEVGPFLNGEVISREEPLYGAKATSVEVRTPASLKSPQEKTAYWTEWARHFREKGWFDRLFLYIWDEPAPEQFPQVAELAHLARQVAPKIPVLLTTAYTRKLSDLIDIWTPLLNCFEPKPGPETFCDEVPPLKVYEAEREKGKKLWLYQSCGSHGCDIAGQRYFTGWPSYMIDASGTANRIMQWIVWKYRADGELYYNTNQSYVNHADPWASAYVAGGNGDGTLFYPGRPERIGGRTHIPIESLRLKLIRDGLEDYEYLALLEKLAGREAAEKFVGRLVEKVYQWESRPEVLLQVRAEIGAELERLVAGSFRSGGK